uniref:DUF4113 domain-containing protein n=1 Tax=Proteus mirabilis TaxID=584 RepID=UPI00374E683B
MGSCAAPSAKGDDKFITTDYLQQCHIAYAKAGIMLADFSGKEAQLDLFDSATPSAGSEALMAVLDGINRRGKSQLFFAGQGIDNSFAMRRQMLSPDYTTDWRSIPTATIK